MNDEYVIIEISKLTKNWSLDDWKNFRSKNNYWLIKDTFNKKWYNKKYNKWNNNAYSRWLQWKLAMLKENDY